MGKEEEKRAAIIAAQAAREAANVRVAPNDPPSKRRSKWKSSPPINPFQKSTKTRTPGG